MLNNNHHGAWIAAAPWQTLSHGDFKAGNIFVKEDSAEEICVIDWQWTGWNIAAHDVLYFFRRKHYRITAKL